MANNQLTTDNYRQLTTGNRQLSFFLPNRRNVPKTHRPPNKLPIWPGLSTNFNLFMQNKANFRKSQMNVTFVLPMDYEQRTLGGVGKTKPNKANSKPIKANLQDAKN